MANKNKKNFEKNRNEKHLKKKEKIKKIRLLSAFDVIVCGGADVFFHVS